MTHIELVDSELRVDGVPRVLLAASLFPFRVPRDQWRDRIRAVARLGYHMLDVYIPWNHHETEPGIWSFDGERDIDQFLSLVEEEGLLVLARPGPYICSEWDGGGLPAWLSQDPALSLRQNEPRYLDAVRGWFDRVLPILARHQATRGGCVALVQVENELDFFDCADPEGYVTALAAMARTGGVDVPLVACAGQGDVVRAGGAVSGVAPAVNLYPDDRSTTVEQNARYYESALRELDAPLLVTETNRLHRTLKRLVVSGARLLGPYLQASGWNGEYGTAVNNWGDLLGFMTHDYDFGGVLRPDGSERPDAAEARRLTSVIGALGRRLAAGRPSSEPGAAGTRAPSATLDLAGGGQLVCVCSLDGHADRAELVHGDEAVSVDVPADRALLLVRGLPLRTVGATIEIADSELLELDEGEDAVRVLFASRGSVRIVLRTEEIASVHADGLAVDQRATTITLTGAQGEAHIDTDRGTLTVVVEPEEADPRENRAPAVSVDEIELGAAGVAPWRAIAGRSRATALEDGGIHRGAARYSAEVDLTGVEALVIRGASDIVDVRHGDSGGGWVANGGTDLLWPIGDASGGPDLLAITTRIWGHSNFDDSRLPSLRLGARRGMTGVLAVRERRPLEDGWTVHAAPLLGSAPAPRSNFGGWMSSTFPQTVTYRRAIGEDQTGSAALHLRDGAAAVTVAVDGQDRGRLDPRSPVLWIGDLSAGATLELTTVRSWGEPTGAVDLLRGYEVDAWRWEVQAHAELARAASDATWVHGAVPVALGAGESIWVRLCGEQIAGDADAVIRFSGRRILITALCGGRLLGRVWSEAPAGATLKGGRGDILLLPAPWAAEGVDLLIEATGDDAALTEIRIGGPIDLEV